MLHIHLLGRFALQLDHASLEIPSRPAQSLLAYLVLNKGAAHRREKLAGLFWPDSDESRARRNLRQALWQIRKALEPTGTSYLLADDITIAFNATAEHWLDIDVFARKDDEEDPQRLAASLAEYVGELLPGFYDEWAALERERLQAIFERKIRQLLDKWVAARRWEQVLEWGERWIAAGGAPEPAYRALMIAHAERGDLSQMAVTYQRCTDALARELGVEPSPQTRALYERLSKGEKEIAGSTPAETRFRLTGELGRGGLGVVYSAHDTLLDRAVAVKVLSPGTLGTEGHARMLREAQSVARLNHTNIVAVYDAGEAPLPGQTGIVPYIVMELVEGQDLHNQRPASVAELVQIAIQICLALEHAHAHGVIHRDLKPENILLTPEGKVKLTDFGLAHFLHASRLTKEGTFIGTPYYIAPEIIRDEEIDARSDLYSLGVVLYELAAGRLPFTGDNLTAIVSQHLHAPVSPPNAHNPTIPPALNTLILHLLNKQPADRPPTAAAVRTVLETLAGISSPRDTQPAPGEPPYKGLQQFDESDVALFYGRESLTEKLLLRLIPPRREGRVAETFLAVVGASGSGKSSLMRAGLIPALRRTLPQSLIYLLTPTARPVESLAAILTRGVESVSATATLMDDLARDPRSLHLLARRLCGESHAARLFLVVDQFEELFTLCRNETERETFLNNLLTAAAPDGIVTMIVALRADFYAHCATFAPLREALASHQEFISPMQADELRQAIEEPARQENWLLEEGLADLLLKDVQGEPGSLPLLSHTLLETWARRRGRTLTLAGFAQTGGVRGALARTAERVYQDFTPEEQKSCRNIFLRLTEPGMRAEGDDLPALDTRRRAALPELILHPDDAPLVETVVQTLADARLITTSAGSGAGSVEVAHESLIREWPTLRGWLEEDREGLRLHRHLTEAAQAWAARAREAGELYRGARLAQATEWAAAHPQALNALEREFLLASQTWAEREIREREAQRQHELETAQKLAETERQRAEEQTMASRRLRQRAWLLAGAGALVSLLAVIAIIVGQQARAQARIAFARELAAASENSLTVDPERSVLLALEAIAVTYEQDGTVIREAETALHRALPALRALLTLPGHEGRVSGISVSPDGNLLATASADGTVKLWNIALAFTGQREIRTLTGHEDWVYTVHFSPDGTRLASASADGTVRVWETATGRQLLTLPGHEFGAGDSAFSPDGKFLATGDGNGTVFLWDVSTPLGEDDPAPLGQFSGPAGVTALGFSPDGHWLAMGSGEGTTVVWELDGDGLPRANQPVFSLCCHSGGVGMLVFSLDSARLATSGNDNSARLWEMAEGQEILAIYSHGGPVDGLAFDATGTRLATGSGDGTARVWDVTPGQAGARELVTIYVNNLIGVAFSPDSTRLVTGSESGSATVWDLSPSREKVTLAGHTDWVFDVAFSPSGNLLATASNDGTVKIWDAETGAEWRTLAGHSAQVWHLAFNPDGTKLVTTSSDTTAKVWEVQTGQELFTLTGHVETLEAFPYTGVGPAVFSPDGRWIATGGGDHTARLWDAETGALLRVFSGHTLDVNGVAFTPDGTGLLTVSFDSTVKVWETATGNLLTTLSIPGEEYGLWGFALSPDGMYLAVSQHDGSISMWDVNGNLEQPLYTLTGHTSIVTGLAFSPDGARLATASFDGTTKLWEVRRGVEWLTLSGHSGNVIGVAFSPDGTHLATSSGDGTARVYVLPIEDLIAFAHSRLTRGWLEEECQQFLHLVECP